jgi:hypothetical protein
MRVPVTRAEFFTRLSELDSQRRPLAAMELRDLLTRDRDQLSPEELGVADTPIGEAEADVVIAFATMVDGLGEPEIAAIETARGKPIDRAILKPCGQRNRQALGTIAPTSRPA